MHTCRICAMLLLSCFLLSGCFKRVIDTPIRNECFIADEEGVVFNCHPPLERHYNTATVRIGLKRDWSPKPPWNAIVFSDGKHVKVKVFATSVRGDVYASDVLGRAGGMLDVRFDPPVPKDVGIKQVRIISDSAVQCTDAIWHDFHAK